MGKQTIKAAVLVSSGTPPILPENIESLSEADVFVRSGVKALEGVRGVPSLEKAIEMICIGARVTLDVATADWAWSGTQSVSQVTTVIKSLGAAIDVIRSRPDHGALSAKAVKHLSSIETRRDALLALLKGGLPAARALIVDRTDKLVALPETRQK